MSYYWYKGFLVDEGQQPLHEHIHYWHHVATPFGGEQMLAFHIASKAMRIAFRRLIERNILAFPINDHQLKLLSDREDLHLLSRALKFSSIADAIRESEQGRIRLANPERSLYSKSTAYKPILLTSRHLGYAINSKDVSEIHALVVERLSGIEGDRSDAKMTAILNFVGKLLPMDSKTLIILAYLCSYAFMTPYQGIAKRRSSEYSPGWRFVLGLQEVLLNRKKFRALHRSYTEFSTSLTIALRWTDQQSIVSSHYNALIEFARTQSSKKTDSRRSRLTFEMIADLMIRGQSVHREVPDALALTHLHESYLLEKLPPLAIMKNGKLACTTKTVSKWYNPYIANLSMVLQAFRSAMIVCVYRDLEIESQCRVLREHGMNTADCYVAPHAISRRHLRCGFLKVWEYFLAEGQQNPS